jgi:hypothetical protein
VSIILTIPETKDYYDLERLDPGPHAKLKWQLIKLGTIKNGEFKPVAKLEPPHVVTVTANKMTCDCEDTVFNGNPECKHLRQLRKDRLLPTRGK